MSLTYPVILENGYGASAFSDHEKLSTCGEQWLNEGRMINAFIIDNSGKLFQIKNAKKIRSKNLFPKWLVPYDRRIVEVKYEFNFIRELNLDELKARMTGLFKKLKDIHDEGIENEINSATTIHEVIETIGIE